jgi:hypothetical protein
MLYEMEGVKNPPKYPVRVVLNNRTVSIFGNEDMDSVYKSYDLKTLVLKKLTDEESPNFRECFNLVDS